MVDDSSITSGPSPRHDSTVPDSKIELHLGHAHGNMLFAEMWWSTRGKHRIFGASIEREKGRVGLTFTHHRCRDAPPDYPVAA